MQLVSPNSQRFVSVLQKCLQTLADQIHQDLKQIVPENSKYIIAIPFYLDTTNQYVSVYSSLTHEWNEKLSRLAEEIRVGSATPIVKLLNTKQYPNDTLHIDLRDSGSSSLYPPNLSQQSFNATIGILRELCISDIIAVGFYSLVEDRWACYLGIGLESPHNKRLQHNKQLQLEEKIKNYLYLFVVPLYYYVHKHMHTYYACRSALAAVIARNMSHNLGSHVLPRLSTGGVNGWTKSEPLTQIIKNSQVFNRYLQQRMDFVAQVATEWPTWSEPTWFMRDIMRWFFTQKHLLDHIASSDGLKAHLYTEGGQGTGIGNNQASQKDDIRFHVFMVPKDLWEKSAGKSGASVSDRMAQLQESCINQYQENYIQRPCSCPSGCQACPRVILYTPGDGTSICNLEEDFLISIPGGIVGCHALFTILENFLRNAAKHGYRRSKCKHLDIVIEILYDPQEEISIQNLQQDSYSQFPARLVRIYSNVSRVGGRGVSIKRIQQALALPIVDEKGNRVRKNLGHAEMKIAAGYLQKRDLMHIGSGGEAITGDLEKSLVDILRSENGGRAIIRATQSPIGTLAYEFPVLIHRSVGIVYSENVDANVCCNLLKANRQEWRKQSIYIMQNDEDTDFEFYVYIDPVDKNKRPPWLAELYSILQNSTEFAVGKHKRELQSWIGDDAPQDEMTPLNWLKIAIERYPMRLFVVCDEIPEEIKNFPFIKKRICWIKKDEFVAHLNSCLKNKVDRDQLRLWLHAHWINHLIRDAREDIGSAKSLLFAFNWNEADISYLPRTVPEYLRKIVGKQTVDKELVVLYLDNLAIEGGSLTEWKELDVEAVRILFSRHRSSFEWDVRENKFKSLFNGLEEKPPHYSEVLSGAISYANRLVDAHSAPEKHRRLLLLLAETALLRIGIADERFQEWWNYLDYSAVENLFQQRVTSLFWISPNEYGQRKAPSHRFYSQFKNAELVWSQPNRSGVEILWREGERSLDVVILHQGILDKQFPHKPRKYLTRQVLKWKDTFPWIFITSGRGRPESVPDGVKFIPFASVEACVVGNHFEKLTLMRQLNVIVETGGLS